ncbi:MAG: DUF455 family protein [Pseudomonadota bacterium]
MFFDQPSIFKKLHELDLFLERILHHPDPMMVPARPARDIEVRPIHQLGGRIGLSLPEGKQKLIHDLANIELQAMELGVCTLVQFPWVHQEFREQLIAIILEEAKHLRLCLQALESLGGYWGKWPVHLGLWHAIHPKDSFLERLFIVHRYLEGSGLDSGDTILRRLSGVSSPIVKQTVKTIVDEEVGHVAFGNRWFEIYAKKWKVDSQSFFTRMCENLQKKHPRKDKISVSLREQSHFSAFEIQQLQRVRNL